jgi:acyl-CoA synthetase (AMP-forming)/AMP-acid ligase II
MLTNDTWTYRYPEGFVKHLEQIAWKDDSGQRYQFSDVVATTVWFKQALKQRGVVEKSRVILFIQPGFQLVCALNAIYSIGATAVFIDPWLSRPKAMRLIRQLEGELWLVDPVFKRLLTVLRPFLGKKRWVLSTIGSLSGTEWTIDMRALDTAAFLSFTSGSTGKPKVVKRSYAFLSAQFTVARKYWGKSPLKESSPFFVAMMAALRLGNSVCYPSQKAVKSKTAGPFFLAQLQQENIERIFVAPHLWDQLLTQIEAHHFPTSLKQVIVGGAPISRALVKRSLHYRHAFEGQLVYGSTEVEPIALCSFEAFLAADPLLGVYVGNPIDEIELKLIPPHLQPLDSSVLAQEMAIGEVTVCGDHVCTQYHDSEIDFKRNKIIDDSGKVWHRTGDIGQLRDGKLYLLGRINRILQKDGKSFYPFPLEMSVQESASLSDVGVVQLPTKEIICCIGGCITAVEQNMDWAAMAKKQDWPFDAVVLLKQALPRDERHHSKLAVDSLLHLLTSPLTAWYRKKTIYIRSTNGKRS